MKKILCLAFLLLSGCSPYGPEELDRLTKEDPQFRQMILARDRAHAEMRLVKDDLLVRKRAMDAQIEKLRGEYDAIAKTQNLRIEKLEQTMEANRTFLKRQMEAADLALETKGRELDGLEKTLADVKKVLHESKGITLSAQEKQKWEERILLLSEKIRPIVEEIRDLKIQNRLRKRKISFLK
ncbi:MAG: hypothetical protein HYZ52_00360 [Candidatus Omnitrophica bacterium]|nr:hypothetical protein [Candidatus Omnitrophota bacterium]